VGEQHVYDITVDDNHNFIANGVVAHNSGARKFCMQAKPRDISDLAAITAIYRPGPLKANVHNMYVDAGKNLDKIKYDHPLIEKVLGPTRGFIAFQEQFMSLAVELAGFSPGESDQMRKTLVKKSLDTLDKKSGEKAMLREKFVKGAKEKIGLSEEITNALFDKIEFFSLYGFNKSHSVSYAIDSYYAAWLHTHHEKEWLATILQSASSNPKELAKVIGEVKALGYKFSRVDVNYSGREWTFSEEADAFVPPLGAVKGIGSAAVDEILTNRPYRDLVDLLYNAEGEWRHSKMNKTAFSALCQIEGFSSLEDWKGPLLQNHRQLLAALTEGNNYETLRKGLFGMSPAQLKKARKNGEEVPVAIHLKLAELAYIEDWSRDQKIDANFELTSTIDADLLFPTEVMERIANKNVPKIHDIPPGDGKTSEIGWFCAASVELKKTKNGKTFYRIKAIDDEFRTAWIRVWGGEQETITPYTLWVAKVQHDPQWGFSTSTYKMRKVV
jgi:DNA polymerase III alpha subunit